MILPILENKIGLFGSMEFATNEPFNYIQNSLPLEIL